MAWVGAGIAAVGTVSQMNSAKKAGNAQQAGADAALASQEYMFDETNRLNAPFREGGIAANNALLMRLGLGGASQNGYGTVDSGSLGNFGQTWQPNAQLYASSPEYKNAWDRFISEHNAQYGRAPGFGSDESALPRELAERGFDLNAYNQKASEAAKNDPLYGSLLKKFDQSDLDNDVVYQSGLQFGLDQGNQGINRMAAASGSQLSGATLKALARFGNDYGSTKANEAYNRFNTTNDSIYNKLAGVSGAGQQATNQVAAAGQNMANNNAGIQMGMGNARGASAIAQGNALTNGLSSGFNMYQQQNYLNSLQRQPTYGVAQQPGVTDWVSQG